MFKIQKFLHYTFLNTRQRDMIKNYHNIKLLSNLSKEQNDNRQLNKLNKLLNHAYKNVPYYKSIFNDLFVVNDGRIALKSIKQLSEVPFLTKDIIRQEKSNLHAMDISERSSYKNTSGGSTGEPVVFMQDRYYQNNNLANFNLARSWRGVDSYGSTIYLWGAERDTFEGEKPFKEKVKDFILNSITLNTFTLSPEIIRRYIDILNREQPELIIAYVQSIYEMAKYAKENNIYVKKQKAIHAGAGTVYGFMRDEIEEVFQCKLYNHYGSREVGAIASECNAHDGLHIMMEHTLVEVVDKNGNLCKPGEEGEIVVTTLNNYSMPLIRYKIGDIGIMQEYETCECGCSYPKLQKVVGRTTDLFKTISGSSVMPEYFIHLIGVVCNRGNIKTFQVIQEKLDLIIVKIVKGDEVTEDNLDEIEDKIKLVMGKECKVIFDFVEGIPKTRTGKFLYTISKV